ncbi:MAG TPA: FAD-dependent oxidoreductase, partial [Acidimicrobiales bacterium]
MARYDLVIIGMGSGGMIGAEFAATIGLRVAVVERARVGGDCLWTGCVPSKALLASAKAAHTMRVADTYGLPSVVPEIDTSLVWKRIRTIQQEIGSTDDDPARFEAEGVEIIRGSARIAGPNLVRVLGEGSTGEDRDLETRFILVCTGSRPVVPPIEGLTEAGFLTSETLWDLERAPASMVMIGAGPIATEMSQAFTRLGIATTVLQKGPRILPRDEPDLVDLLVAKLRSEGVDLHFNVEIERVAVSGSRKIVFGSENGEPSRWDGEELLVATGRRPNVEGLGLDEVGVNVTRTGIEVDERRRTAVPSI